MSKRRPRISLANLPDRPLSTAEYNELNASRGGRKLRKDGKPRAKPRDLEHDEQAAVFRWRDVMLLKRPDLADELRSMRGNPNGGHRHAKVGRYMKEEGQKAGTPDIILPVARGEYNNLWIEMKYGDNKPTPEQIEDHELLKRLGNRVEVCYSYEEAQTLIMEYLDE